MSHKISRRVCRDATPAARLLEVWENEGWIASFEGRPEGVDRPTKAYSLNKLGRV
jgi:hypothetical protein